YTRIMIRDFFLERRKINCIGSNGNRSFVVKRSLSRPQTSNPAVYGSNKPVAWDIILRFGHQLADPQERTGGGQARRDDAEMIKQLEKIFRAALKLSIKRSLQ
ncbi:MAG TPA: hypothetical protein VII93_06275, partial [Anaerolineales bacterium]